MINFEAHDLNAAFSEGKNHMFRKSPSLTWGEAKKILKTKPTMSPIGSSIWGLSTKISDVDFICHQLEGNRLHSYLRGELGVEIVESTWNKSWNFLVSVEGSDEFKTINICPQHPVEYNAWKIGSKMMKILAGYCHDKLMDKQARVAAFKGCVALAYSNMKIEEMPSSGE